jgi:hypothetical protein
MSGKGSEPPPPQAQLMQMALGYTTTFLLRVAAQLRIADFLADGAQTAEQLAPQIGAHAPSLHRFMRTLAAIGILAEDEEHRFALTPLGQPLRSDLPGSVRTSVLSITGDLFIAPWSKLAYSVQTGKPSFDHHFGAPFFDHISKFPEEAAWFSDMLIGMNHGDAPAVAAAYDFSGYTHIADIGGATGYMLTTILGGCPGPRGTLFDLPHNQKAAADLIAARGLSDRVTFVTGSFFESVPAGCDLYILSHVIHDWSEEQSLAILASCRQAMSPASRLLILEMILPEGNAFHPGKMLDMTMLGLTMGQERSEAEYAELLEKAGFKLTRVIPTSSPVSIVEAVPV